MTSQPIEATCSRAYHAVHNSGRRDLHEVRWIVLHDEEAATAEGAARWFTNPQSGGSAHLCVDGRICFRTLDNDEIPQAAPGANHAGFHIEQAGFAKWSTPIWLSHLRTLRRAAYKTAVHCHLFQIPPTFRFAHELKRGYAGVTTHAECTLAFGPVGGHTDPGRFWPRRYFMKLVRDYYAQLDLL